LHLCTIKQPYLYNIVYHDGVTYEYHAKSYMPGFFQGNLSVCVILADEDRIVSYIDPVSPQSNAIRTNETTVIVYLL